LVVSSGWPAMTDVTMLVDETSHGLIAADI
jgi:hypothetical protein